MREISPRKLGFLWSFGAACPIGAGMRFNLDRLPTDPVLLQKMLREMAQAMKVERDELKVAKQTVKAQGLTIEKLEHRLARLLRVQFGRSSEKMDNAQLRMMFEDVDSILEPANDDIPAATSKPERKAGSRAPIPAHIPRLTAEHRPEPCGCGGVETVICEDVTEVLDYVPARFRVLRHVRPRIACRSCET
ncbi:MAG: IS66 family transposase zinc-finger binding domain-containing protein, partial [Rhodopila sp.]|nr:IS66 family transposase zinc-finger binding domain-containing protein [Rhodopila sp.]